MRTGHRFLVHFFEGDMLVVIVKCYKIHLVFTFWTLYGIIAKGGQYSSAPLIKTPIDTVFMRTDCAA